MTASNPQKIWLITGASQGLGFCMAMSALKAGHRVIAGARNPQKAAADHPELEQAGGTWLKLDVASVETKAIVQKAVEAAGGIDVLVSNAGYFHSATVEDVTEDEMTASLNTNFFGHLRVIQGVLTRMRAQKSGTVVMNGSINGFQPCPAGSMYSCAKAASDMLCETMKMEVAPFNIRVVVIRAGSYRTQIFNSAQQPSQFSQEYLQGPMGQALAGPITAMSNDPDNHIPGDPVKFGDRVVEFVDGTGYGKGLEKNTGLWIGSDAVSLYHLKLKYLTEGFEACEKIAMSTDYDGFTGKGMAAFHEYF